ncbi:MAG: DUF4013 domain-containing protein [Planctomycetaceae bacterium]
MSAQELKPSSSPPERPDWLPPRKTSQSVEITDFHAETGETVAEVPLLPDIPDTSGRVPISWHRPFSAVAWVIRSGFAILSLILLLAVIAAIPIVNFVALGYLLEVEGRVARSGRFRDAFPLLEIAPRLGAIVLGVWLWLISLRLFSAAAADARLIDPAGRAAVILSRLTVIAAFAIAIHLLLALARGGKFWCFFRPIKNLRSFVSRVRAGTFWSEAEQNVRDFVRRMQLRHHFWLGLRGYAGAFVWLLIPTALLAVADKTEPGPLIVSVVGGLSLIAVFSWLPFLQARFATENRFRAFFELKSVRQRIARAPLAWLIAVIAVYVLALPLYLFKVVAPPRDALWFITPVFIMSIYPAKVLVGWAYHRGERKQRPASWIFRWGARVAIIPLLAAYVVLLFLTPTISQHGKLVLFEHHAFLLPVPF